MTIHVYGIPNCDTVKKARKWLEARELEYAFHDFKKEGVEREDIESWIALLGLESVLNKRGTTFRKLSDEDKEKAGDPALAADLMQEHTSMIKRPVVVHSGGILIGFREGDWAEALG